MVGVFKLKLGSGCEASNYVTAPRANSVQLVVVDESFAAANLLLSGASFASRPLVGAAGDLSYQDCPGLGS